MKNLFSAILLLSSLSAMAKDIYLDCKLPTHFSEGFRESKVIQIDGSMSPKQGQLCFKSLKAKIKTTTCSYGWCGEDETPVSTESVSTCYETETLAMTDIIGKICQDAGEVEAEIGTRKVDVEPQTEVKPQDC